MIISYYKKTLQFRNFTVFQKFINVTMEDFHHSDRSFPTTIHYYRIQHISLTMFFSHVYMFTNSNAIAVSDGVPTGVGTPSVSTPEGFFSVSLSLSLSLWVHGYEHKYPGLKSTSNIHFIQCQYSTNIV